MKQLLLFLVFLFLAACGTGGSSDGNGQAPDLEFTLDTVQIDAKGEILFLNNSLRFAALSTDKQYLYNLNSQTYHFAKDGKIWIFENIEDEMGFVRLSFDL